jgi:hypothetical protein
LLAIYLKPGIIRYLLQPFPPAVVYLLKSVCINIIKIDERTCMPEAGDMFIFLHHYLAQLHFSFAARQVKLRPFCLENSRFFAVLTKTKNLFFN